MEDRLKAIRENLVLANEIREIITNYSKSPSATFCLKYNKGLDSINISQEVSDFIAISLEKKMNELEQEALEFALKEEKSND